MKKCTMFIVFLAAIFSFAQPPDTLWTRIFGGIYDDAASCVRQTSEGGYIMAGWTESYGAGGSDVYLIKTDAGGDSIWTKTYGGSDGDAAQSVVQAFDGGYIVAGVTASFGIGNGDYYLVKAGPGGDSLWAEIYGGLGVDWGFSVDQTLDGGYIIAGVSMLLGGNMDAYLVRTDTGGAVIWERTYGGNGNDGVVSVQETSDSGYIAAGMTSSNGVGMADVYLVKIDPDGDTIWTRTFGGFYDDMAMSVQQTADGGYIIAGETYPSLSGESDVYLIKTDALGDTIWTRTYGGADADAANSVQQTLDGGYIIAGHTTSFGVGGIDVWLIKTDAGGDTLWTQTYGGVGEDVAASVQQTSDSGYIIAGYTESIGAGGFDVWLIKTAPDVGIEECMSSTIAGTEIGATIFCGPLQLPEGKKCKVFDITGRVVEPEKIAPGIYFVEIDNEVVQKVVKIR